jgi:hypothetical protein
MLDEWREHDRRVMRDRNQALVFIVLVLVISWGFEVYIIANGGVRNFGPFWIVALMCVPGVLSIVLRVIHKSGSDLASLARSGKSSDGADSCYQK